MKTSLNGGKQTRVWHKKAGKFTNEREKKEEKRTVRLFPLYSDLLHPICLSLSAVVCRLTKKLRGEISWVKKDMF